MSKDNSSDAVASPLLTNTQRVRLQQAARHELGLVELQAGQRYGGASIVRSMQRLCELGLFVPYVHGGWQITDLGRAACTIASPATKGTAPAVDPKSYR